MNGRPPKTKHAKKSSGAWMGKGQDGSMELDRPTSGTADTTPPEWLNADEVEIWDQFVVKAVEMKTFKNADHFTFGLFCRSASELLKMMKELSIKGYTYAAVYYSKDGDENSVPKKHPLVDVVKQLRDEYNIYANQFGFNPLSRTKLMVVPYETPLPEGEQTGSTGATVTDMMGLKKVQ